MLSLTLVFFFVSVYLFLHLCLCLSCTCVLYGGVAGYLGLIRERFTFLCSDRDSHLNSFLSPCNLFFQERESLAIIITTIFFLALNKQFLFFQKTIALTVTCHCNSMLCMCSFHHIIKCKAWNELFSNNHPHICVQVQKIWTLSSIYQKWMFNNL